VREGKKKERKRIMMVKCERGEEKGKEPMQ
jgi:hypothetical protein